MVTILLYIDLIEKWFRYLWNYFTVRNNWHLYFLRNLIEMKLWLEIYTNSKIICTRFYYLWIIKKILFLRSTERLKKTNCTFDLKNHSTKNFGFLLECCHLIMTSSMIVLCCQWVFNRNCQRWEAACTLQPGTLQLQGKDDTQQFFCHILQYVLSIVAHLSKLYGSSPIIKTWIAGYFKCNVYSYKNEQELNKNYFIFS